MILARELPLFVGETERVLFYLLAKWASEHQYIHLEDVFYDGIKDITRELGEQMFTHYERIDVFHKIIQIRDSFSKFRNFISSEFVDYEPLPNRVTILPGYFKPLNGVQEPAHIQEFRNHGYPNYFNCKYVFVTCKAALFWGEYPENYYENFPNRESDTEDEGFIKYDPIEAEVEDIGGEDEDVANYGGN